MIKKLCVCTVLVMGFSVTANAAAPACSASTAAPLGSSATVDTTTASDGISGIGPYTLAGNQVVWTFTTPADPADITGTIEINGDWGWGIFITESCDAGVPTSDLVDQLASNGTSPSGDTQTFTLDPADFTGSTTYYVILSGLDAAAGAGLSATGASDVTFNSTLPVKLQGFSAK